MSHHAEVSTFVHQMLFISPVLLLGLPAVNSGIWYNNSIQCRCNHRFQPEQQCHGDCCV